jgi:hypothetical protein
VSGDVYWLVEALVARLREVVPEGYTVSPNATGFGVGLSSTDPPILELISYVKDIVEQPRGTFESRVESAAWNVLSSFQDFIAEDTPLPATSGGLPNPETAVRDGVLQLWYGDEEEPDLRLPPIEIPAPGS